MSHPNTEEQQTDPSQDTNESQSTPPQIPPTNNQQAQPTNQEDPYKLLLERTIASQNKRLQELQDQIVTQTRPAPVQVDPEEERTRYYNDPVSTTRKLITEELERTVGPIAEFVREFRGRSQVDKFVDQFKTDPRFKNKWDQSVENYVRDNAAAVDPKQLTEQSFGFLVVGAVGMKELGMLPGSTPTPEPEPTLEPPMRTTPPHMRPTPPAGPTNNNPPRLRPLTEDEQRILREYNNSRPKDKQMTHEQYLKWQELPGSDVASSELGQPARTTK